MTNFRIILARTNEQLQRVALVRSLAYSKHVPTLAETLKEPEPMDFRPGTVTIACEDTRTNAIVGSLRINLNVNQQLVAQQTFTLREELEGQLLAEVTRLSVPSNRRAPLIKLLLMKALFLYCHAKQVKWIIALARTPLDKEYEAMLFEEISIEKGFRPLFHVANVPHKALGLNVQTAERIWLKNNHPFYGFMFLETHPEIQLFESIKPIWENPRVSEPPRLRPDERKH
jgi:hypothetical protein